MQKLLTSLLGIFLLASMAGCTTQQTQNEQNVQVVKIGVIAPLSGPAAMYGDDVVRAYTYAVEEFNTSQDKYQMQLIFEDGKCDQKDATSAAQKLIDIDKVDFLLGGPCSVETIGASNVAKQYGLSIVSSVASAGKLNTFGNIIRYLNDDVMGKELGTYASQISNHITIITENDEYGVGFRDDFTEAYKGNVVDTLTFNPDEKDFAMLARQVSRNNIDGVMGIFHTEDSLKNFLMALQKNPQGGATFSGQWYFPYLCTSETLRADFPTLMEGAVCIDSLAVAEMATRGQERLATYKQQHPISGIEGRIPFYKETIDIIGQAILAGNTSRNQIESYLRSYDETKSRKGYVGEYYFDANGDAVGLGYSLQKIENGEVVFLN